MYHFPSRSVLLRRTIRLANQQPNAHFIIHKDFEQRPTSLLE